MVHLQVRKYCIAVPILKYEWYGGLWGARMKSSVVKHSIVIDGHKTSVSLEDAFWSELKEIAHARQATLGTLVAKIDETRRHGNLSSAIRLFVLEYFRTNGRK
jgi:predicted DNA-binding ribbon-helix-helix protein